MDFEQHRGSAAPALEVVRRRGVARGPSRFAEVERDHRIIDGGTNAELPAERRTQRSVVNDQYAARWTAKGAPGVLHQYDHASVKSMSTTVSEELQIGTGDKLEQYVFGGGGATLAETYATSSVRSGSRWEAREVGLANDEKGFALDLHVEPKGQPPVLMATWILNADRGFVATQYQAYKAPGVVGVERKAVVERVGVDGAWFPTKVTETTYRNWVMPATANVRSPEASLPHRVRRMRLTDVTLNAQYPDDQFTLKALGAPEGTLVARTLLDGTQATYVIKHGASLLNDLATGIQHAEGDIAVLKHLTTQPTRQGPTTASAAPHPAKR